MSTCSHPATASIAAEPVSPLVAPTIVTRSPTLGEHVIEHPADELQRDVLEGQRGPVEQLVQPLPVVESAPAAPPPGDGTCRTPR